MSGKAHDVALDTGEVLSLGEEFVSPRVYSIIVKILLEAYHSYYSIHLG